jgi:hypothetical protein
VVWFDLVDRPGRLLFVIHHLARQCVGDPDGGFWRTYEHLAQGQEVDCRRRRRGAAVGEAAE